MPLYFGINKNRPDLKKSLDQALESLYFDNPGFQTSMHDKYFSMNKEQLPVFSKAEQEFLRKKTPVRVALQIDNAPFCFVDDKGKPIGVIPDLYAKLAQISGLNFTYLTAPTMMDAIALVENGKADVVGKLTMDACTGHETSFADEQALHGGGPDPGHFKERRSHPDGGRTHSPAFPFVGQTVTGAHGKPAVVVLMPNSNQAFAALKAGKVDAAYLNSASTNYLLNSQRTEEYNFTALPAHNYSLVAGISLNGDPVLFGLLNKCLRYVSTVPPWMNRRSNIPCLMNHHFHPLCEHAAAYGPVRYFAVPALRRYRINRAGGESSPSGQGGTGPGGRKDPAGSRGKKC
jgi:hypothetical protein